MSYPHFHNAFENAAYDPSFATSHSNIASSNNFDQIAPDPSSSAEVGSYPDIDSFTTLTSPYQSNVGTYDKSMFSIDYNVLGNQPQHSVSELNTLQTQYASLPTTTAPTTTEAPATSSIQATDPTFHTSLPDQTPTPAPSQTPQAPPRNHERNFICTLCNTDKTWKLLSG